MLPLPDHIQKILGTDNVLDTILIFSSLVATIVWTSLFNTLDFYTTFPKARKNLLPKANVATDSKIGQIYGHWQDVVKQTFRKSG